MESRSGLYLVRPFYGMPEARRSQLRRRLPIGWGEVYVGYYDAETNRELVPEFAWTVVEGIKNRWEMATPGVDEWDEWTVLWDSVYERTRAWIKMTKTNLDRFDAETAFMAASVEWENETMEIEKRAKKWCTIFSSYVAKTSPSTTHEPKSRGEFLITK